MTSGPKGGPLEKNFFQNMSFMIWKWLFWWKKTFYSYFETNLKPIGKFSKLVEKKFKGWPQDQRGDHWKKFFFKTCRLWFENDCFDERKRFMIFWNEFEAYWKIFKTGPKKNLRGDLRTKGGTIGKKFFQNMSFMIWKWLFWWKKTFYSYFKTNLKA